MESVATFFKKENDLVYLAGVMESKKEVVRNLLIKTDFSNSKIADIANVAESSVEKIRNELK